MSERIAKIIARSGYCSRRDAEKLILEKRVSVDGEILESPAFNVTGNESITIDGKSIAPQAKTRLWLYHKPRGLITSHKDPKKRKTVFQALPRDLGRVISIGRLDINTEGLLLLTNDGQLSREFELPSSAFRRCYLAKVHGNINQKILKEIRVGLKINSVQYMPAEIEIKQTNNSNTWVEITICEGKNREIRNIFEHFGMRVARLIRTSYHTFKLGDLQKGAIQEVPSSAMVDFL